MDGGSNGSLVFTEWIDGGGQIFWGHSDVEFHRGNTLLIEIQEAVMCRGSA